jgi:hypothetical protein
VIVLLVGSYVPSPVFKQYYYAPMPLMVLGLALAFRADDSAQRRLARLRWIAGAAAVAFAFGIHNYVLALPVLVQQSQWIPMRIHERGVMVRNMVGDGPVVTFAPVIPLEGGVEIFPGLATGPYATRVSHMLSREQRSKLIITGQEEIEALIEDRRAAGVLLGAAIELEEDAKKWALASGYQTCWEKGDAKLLVRAASVDDSAMSAADTSAGATEQK